ncbi:MAG: hypothetical protein P8Y02_15070 [Deinococcales bacterium]
MAKDVIMPVLGMNQDTAVLLNWLKQEGEQVEEGEPIMEVETDKATMELDAPASGTLARVTARAGEEVKVAGRGIGVRKFGAALGDGVSIGCNAVLAPGTIVGRGTIIYNGAMVRGVVGAHRLIKLRQTHEDVEAAPRGG